MSTSILRVGIDYFLKLCIWYSDQKFILCSNYKAEREKAGKVYVFLCVSVKDTDLIYTEILVVSQMKVRALSSNSEQRSNDTCTASIHTLLL